MTSQPRILVLFGNVPLLGQERANIETLHALMETDCAVRFLIRTEHTHDTIQPELTRRGIEFDFVPYFPALRHGVSLRTWWGNAVNILTGSWALLKHIRAFGATHIHAGSTANVINFLPALVLTRLPLIFRAGDLPPLHHPLWRWVWAFTRRRAAHIVCDSLFLEGALTRLGVDKSRSTVIYAPPPRRGTCAPTNAAELGGSSGTAVLYIGQVSHSKGVHLIVEAALAICQLNVDARFLIAGDYEWNNSFALDLIAKVRSAGLADRIVFTGFVEDIDLLYAQASVHLCPSLVQEGYGLTVLEAKFRSVPSIVFASGALPELVTDGIDGMVCTDKSADSLRQAIEQYIAQPALARRHGAQAHESLRRLALDEFSLKWKSVYQRSMNRPPSRKPA
jgi:glycosyltransferase involved in cell wall biosynthesis